MKKKDKKDKKEKEEIVVEPSITVQEEDGVITINLPEKFDFNSHSEFRITYCEREKGLTYKLNFIKTTYVDSSALGMLLLMKEHNGNETDEKLISMVNCNKQVMNILSVANFDRLFNIN